MAEKLLYSLFTVWWDEIVRLLLFEFSADRAESQTRYSWTNDAGPREAPQNLEYDTRDGEAWQPHADAFPP
jgi:hypothetical protein